MGLEHAMSAAAEGSEREDAPEVRGLYLSYRAACPVQTNRPLKGRPLPGKAGIDDWLYRELQASVLFPGERWSVPGRPSGAPHSAAS